MALSPDAQGLAGFVWGQKGSVLASHTMPLSSFSVSRYRSFLDETRIDLRPLTLLFGYNNAGKSTLMRVPPLLADSSRIQGPLPLDLDSLAVRGSSFKDLATRLVANDRIELRLSWDDTEPGEVRSVWFLLRDLPDRFRQVVEEFRIFGHQNSSLLHARWQPSEQGTRKDLGNSYSVEMPEGSVEGGLALNFTGLMPRSVAPPPQNSLHVRALEHCSRLGSLLSSLTSEVRWLGSVRTAPARSKRLLFANIERLAPDGSEALDVLAYDQAVGGSLLSSVSNWYVRHTQQRLDVEQVAPGYYAMTLGPVNAPGVRVNLADTGEGMAQVLPVLVAGALAHVHKEGSQLLTVEQPELHLHPGIHAPLAEYFCELARLDPKPRMLIETHSENFLYGVQLAIVRKKLQPDRVRVYWIRQLEDGRSIAEPIDFDEMARPLGPWPPEVFSEDVALAREIIRERRARESA